MHRVGAPRLRHLPALMTERSSAIVVLDAFGVVRAARSPESDIECRGLCFGHARRGVRPATPANRDRRVTSGWSRMRRTCRRARSRGCRTSTDIPKSPTTPSSGPAETSPASFSAHPATSTSKLRSPAFQHPPDATRTDGGPATFGSSPHRQIHMLSPTASWATPIPLDVSPGRRQADDQPPPVPIVG